LIKLASLANKLKSNPRARKWQTSRLPYLFPFPALSNSPVPSLYHFRAFRSPSYFPYCFFPNYLFLIFLLPSDELLEMDRVSWRRRGKTWKENEKGIKIGKEGSRKEEIYREIMRRKGKSEGKRRKWRRKMKRKRNGRES
jgi:hypothetical protein